MSSRRLFLPGFVLLVSVIVAPAASAQTWTPEQQEIWKVEELQWKMSMEKDATWIDKMVHPNISVWEVDRPMPQNKASLTRWNKYTSSNSTILEQEIFPISISITGNVAVVQYTYLTARENYKKERETVSGRWTDILIKEGGRWMFIAWAGGDDPESD
ncbi:MAG: nuclear transport factor 2 family protein [Thermoanaerobaculia bacterium]